MIPKQAFFVYGEHHTAPLPDLGLKNMEDFKRLNPGWNVQLITAENSDPQYLDIYHWSKVAWSEVIRFDLMVKFGGLYSDIDVVYYGPVPDFNNSDLVIAIETHRHATDAFFASVPGHPVMVACRDQALEWCKTKMLAKEAGFTSGELLDGASCGMFSRVVRDLTKFDLAYQNQVHMAKEDFNGSFHPENGVGILPFEAMCRHSQHNWVGWHQCWGSWRPRHEDGKVDMGMESVVEVNA